MCNARKLDWKYKTTLTHMCKCRVGQHLIVPNLYSILISKVLDTEFITVQISPSLNSNKKISTQ